MQCENLRSFFLATLKGKGKLLNFTGASDFFCLGIRLRCILTIEYNCDKGMGGGGGGGLLFFGFK